MSEVLHEIVRCPEWQTRYKIHGAPMLIHIEDEHVTADEFVLAGWVGYNDKGEGRLVGSVVAVRIGSDINHTVTHEHVYMKDLPGRKITHVSTLALGEYKILAP